MGKRPGELKGDDWRYLMIALRELARARLTHASTPAGTIVAGLRDRNNTPPSRARSSIDLRQLSWAIGAVAERVPWRADCLLRAMAAERILRDAGHAPQFQLGVARGGENELKAHAWLTCDGETITGGDWSAYTALITPALDQAT